MAAGDWGIAQRHQTRASGLARLGKRPCTMMGPRPMHPKHATLNEDRDATRTVVSADRTVGPRAVVGGALRRDSLRS